MQGHAFLPGHSALSLAGGPCPEHIPSPLLVIEGIFPSFSLATMCFHKCPKCASICYPSPSDTLSFYSM